MAMNVDELMELAKNDPEALEAYRLAEIELIIESAPEGRRRRLRGMQFEIDAIKAGSKNPLDDLQAKMWNKFKELNEALQRLRTGDK